MTDNVSLFTSHVKYTYATNGYAGGMQTKGDRIRELRLSKEMTQQDLADECGVTREAVSQWESGSTENIKNKTYLYLLKALGTTAAYLEFGPDERSKTGRIGRPRSLRDNDSTS